MSYSDYCINIFMYRYTKLCTKNVGEQEGQLFNIKDLQV